MFMIRKWFYHNIAISHICHSFYIESINVIERLGGIGSPLLCQNRVETLAFILIGLLYLHIWIVMRTSNMVEEYGNHIYVYVRVLEQIQNTRYYCNLLHLHISTGFVSVPFPPNKNVASLSTAPYPPMTSSFMPTFDEGHTASSKPCLL